MTAAGGRGRSGHGDAEPVPRSGNDQVRIEVDELMPVFGTGEECAIVRHSHERRPADRGFPIRAWQDPFDDTAEDQAAPAVAEGVDAGSSCPGDGREQLDDALSVLKRIEAERGVIDPDDQVVRLIGLGEEAPALLGLPKGPKAVLRTRERAVHEQQDAPTVGDRDIAGFGHRQWAGPSGDMTTMPSSTFSK